MKVSTQDILRIMRLFGRADDDHVPKDSTQLTIKHPSPTNTLASFLHLNKQYAILFDDMIDDNMQLLTNEIQKIHHNAQVEIIENPRTGTPGYGMPYQGKICYLATLDDHLVRLDSYLAEQNPEFSRSSWQQFIRQGFVMVNDTVAKKPKQPVGPDDTIQINLPDKATHRELNLPIIYQDDDILVIDKPAGVLTHAKNERDDEFTVESFVLRYIDGSIGIEERHGIVHRLDRDTSGLIVCALNRLAYEHLKMQFANRQVDKTYYALTHGIPAEVKAIISIPIMRSLTAPGTFVADLKGKPAETYYAVIDHQDDKSLLRLQPKTGRTHQLRVHLAHINTPIIGDRLYGATKKPDSRMYLHASRLQFTNRHGDTLEFESNTPEEFNQKLRSL